MHTPATIDSADLRTLMGSATPPRVLDVRTPGEFDTVHMPGAYNVPLDLLREHRDEILSHLDQDVVLVCRSGQRAAQAEETLRRAGLTNVHVLDGGITAWEAKGFAVNAGLTFAAVTNTCAMGMLLARLPYNRGATCDMRTVVAQLVDTSETK